VGLGHLGRLLAFRRESRPGWRRQRLAHRREFLIEPGLGITESMIRHCGL
jgi:hypothetical protein